MELFVKLIFHDTTSSLMYLFCYTFALLNFAHLAIQDKASSGMKESHHTGDYILKPEDKYKKFEILYSLEDTWQVINSPQFSSLPVVKKIKQMWASKKPRKLIYKKPRIKRKNATTTTPRPFNISGEEFTTTAIYETTTRARLPGRQHPFVLVEGTLTNTRRKLTRGLMKHTTFMYIRTFRQTPFKYREQFRGIDLLRLRRAFITLQFYMTAKDLESILEERPVIMSGFWMRRAVEYLARKHTKDLPPAGDPCYKWPADLTRPDLVFFLHTPRNDSTLLEQTKKRLARMNEIYRRMDPSVIMLDDSYNNMTDKKISTLRKIMLDRLSDKYPHCYDDYLKCTKPSDGRRPKKVKPKTQKSTNKTTEDGSIKDASESDKNDS